MQTANLKICDGNQETGDYIRQEIIKYNKQYTKPEGYPTVEPIYLVLEDESGNIVGGINATIKGLCHVDIFWIHEACRRTGYGTLLLRRIEEIALNKGCRFVQLDTFSFQAPEFYKKQGYEQFGTLEDYPMGYCQYFFFKKLV